MGDTIRSVEMENDTVSLDIIEKAYDEIKKIDIVDCVFVSPEIYEAFEKMAQEKGIVLHKISESMVSYLEPNKFVVKYTNGKIAIGSIKPQEGEADEG